ncbi:hypothetical protein G7Y41_09025 [Schaalia sp. ZJ405]|uniref:hypothetical protein n=1 Tax=Schaalia sp. ZJ405 TaxID=2709403 RepID=UPI0013EA675C|nr:hypothetical protein [Schaalia sp. ZJ405]QPK81163.1 hypothetical protein G7Y41_09025 [Schaalia sp. ZJ405]
MQIFKHVLKSLTLAFIATAALSAATVIALMFTKGKEMGHHVGLFGSLFFDAHETQTGSVMVGVGVENTWTLTLVFLAIFIVSNVFFTILSALHDRKRFLEQRAANTVE